MECEPTPSELTARLARPVESTATVATDCGLPSTKKLTRPVGVPAPAATGVMVAVKITVEPTLTTVAVEDSVVVVLAGTTLTAIGADGWLAMKEALPLKTAWAKCVPTAALVSVNDAWPAAFRVIGPVYLPSMKKNTAP